MVCVWGLQWKSKNEIDGETKHIIHENLLPLLFKRKHQATIYARKRYGYIAKRKDLRADPHGWRMPKPVKLIVEAYDDGGTDA